MFGTGKCGVCCTLIAKIRLNPDIVGHFVPDRRRTGFGGLICVGYTRQRLVIDHHGIGCVFGLRQRFSDDDGKRLADIACLVGRQQHMIADKRVGSTGAMQLLVMLG